MINIIRRCNGKQFTIEVVGHANYAPHGQDIVCAAISVLFQNLLLSIERLTEDKVISNIKNNKSTITIKDPSDKTKLLIDSFFIGVTEISTIYSKYVMVNSV